MSASARQFLKRREDSRKLKEKSTRENQSSIFSNQGNHYMLIKKTITKKSRANANNLDLNNSIKQAGRKPKASE